MTTEPTAETSRRPRARREDIDALTAENERLTVALADAQDAIRNADPTRLLQQIATVLVDAGLSIDGYAEIALSRRYAVRALTARTVTVESGEITPEAGNE